MSQDTRKILIVEDNILVNMAIQDIAREAGHDVEACDNGKDATKILKNDEIDLVLLDMILPDVRGDQLLTKWKKSYPQLAVIFITAHGDVPTAVDCLKAGAYDFLVKPVDKNVLQKTIEKALEHRKMSEKVDRLTELNSRSTDTKLVLDNVICGAPKMQKTMSLIKLVAQSDFSSVLLEGESGTGKGMLAKYIHKSGRRSKKPFVEVNCSALPASLIESELFGHKKGAFTDAKEDKIGLFEMADGGTLFLDEIGDMDIELQTKLLKVMEEQRFRRIGGTKDIQVDVAIIAATNQNVSKLVEDNKFRLDLYYRLNVIPLELPPLRERKEDIRDLADYFINFFSRKLNKQVSGFSEEVMELLHGYSWPGNVREFRNVVERSCILTSTALIDDPTIVFPGRSHAMNADSKSQEEMVIPAMPLSQAEQLVIEAAMKEAQGNKNKAAAILGLHRTTLYKKLEEYQI